MNSISRLFRKVNNALLGGELDLTQYHTPLPKMRIADTPTTTPTPPTNLANWGKTRDASIVHDDNSNADTLSVVWQPLSPTNTAKFRQSADITDREKQLLELAKKKNPSLGLSYEKLLDCKKWWLKEMNRDLIVAQYKREGIKGFSDKVVNVLLSIYNTNEREEATQKATQ